ncbi:MAG TPA: cytochrome c biogenesis protein CcdA [Bryobacteraceae bacterium]|nr:cytochrome c biogenesis protein CcdA [Bryobacteraceae bacterium]
MTSGFLWLAASTGLLSLLTPCVFPMVPVTIAYFSSAENRRATGFRGALLFGLGIVGTFTVLGLVLAALFGAAGLNRFAADPWVNITLAALFLLFALNLFGWFELTVPSRILTAAYRGTRESSHGASLGALLMGATFTLTSVTCTAPFVGTLLVLAARGSWSAPVVGMIVYSSAFALPFVLLAIAPRFVGRLPRSGEWIRNLRVTIGFLEVAAAIKFVSNADLVLGWGVFTREVVLLAWMILALAAAGYLLLQVRGGVRRREISFGPIVAAAAALAIAAWLSTGLSGKTLPQVEAFLPPRAPVAVVATAGAAASEWMLNDYDAALAAARKSNRLVFVDFTGYTCTNCRWMEANIFNRPDVGAQLGQFVLARLYTDGDGELYERQQAFQEKTFGTVALPLYAVVDAEGKVRATFTGLTRDPSEFIDFLRRAAAGAS